MRRTHLVFGSAVALFTFQSFAQAPPRPEFDVASLKLNTGCGGNRGGSGGPSIGRLNLTCMPLRILIRTAYATFADGPQINPRQMDVLGGPAWLDSDLYDLAARAEGNPPLDIMAGPMLQRLLEDRCNVKVHKEAREVPVYALTVGKSGSKLQPTKENSCVPLDMNHLPSRPPLGQPQPTVCGAMAMTQSGPNISASAGGITLAQFAGRMLAGMDRPVIDKTGLNGMFDINLHYTRDTIVAAVQEQLGLQLSPDKGPVEVLVIDHVDKPSAN